MVKEGSEIIQTAVVCRVNKIKYPDECLAKILQIKSQPFKEVYQLPEYKYNQLRNFERYLFVSNKYKPENAEELVDGYDEFEMEKKILDEYPKPNEHKFGGEKEEAMNPDN